MKASGTKTTKQKKSNNSERTSTEKINIHNNEWVLNHENVMISIHDFEKGVVKSGNYTCIYCKNKMTYVDGHTRINDVVVKCYFRHHADTCLTNVKESERKQYIEN